MSILGSGTLINQITPIYALASSGGGGSGGGAGPNPVVSSIAMGDSGGGNSVIDITRTTILALTNQNTGPVLDIVFYTADNSTNGSLIRSPGNVGSLNSYATDEGVSFIDVKNNNTATGNQLQSTLTIMADNVIMPNITVPSINGGPLNRSTIGAFPIVGGGGVNVPANTSTLITIMPEGFFAYSLFCQSRSNDAVINGFFDVTTDSSSSAKYASLNPTFKGGGNQLNVSVYLDETDPANPKLGIANTSINIFDCVGVLNRIA